ncbi:hypothetical protein GCM10027051_23570 [Niabella terrae]
MKKIAAKFTMVAVSAFFATAAMAQTDTTQTPVPDTPEVPAPDSTPAPVPEPEPEPVPDTTKAPELSLQQSVQDKQSKVYQYTDIYAGNREVSAIKSSALKDENDEA